MKDIKTLLFPQIKIVKEGCETYYIDESVDMNLQSCIQDIKDGYKDEILIKTLMDIHKRLTQARNMLEVDMAEIKEPGHYIIRS